MKAWKSLNLEPNSSLNFNIGFLKLWLKNGFQEWHAASDYSSKQPVAFSSSNQAEYPVELEWTRWVLPSDAFQININPIMPDRPLVVRPAFNMKIPAGVKAEFNIGIPVWLQMLSDKGRMIFNIASEVLSNTWFGPMESGELCYALASSILSASEDLKPFKYKAICPVTITNESGEDLDLRRVCIQVKHLSLYNGQDRFWTNRVRINYRGEDQISTVAVDSKAPGSKSDFDLLTGPREKVSGSFVKKTFSSIREIAGI